MQKTTIGWCDYSVNPLKMELPDATRLNVCVHKSEGCRNCYAEKLVRMMWHRLGLEKKYGSYPGYTAALLKLGKPVLVEKDLQAILRLDRAVADGSAPTDENGRIKNRVFWSDMTDEYLDYWPDELLDMCWAARALTPNLIHQVLTKRIERTESYFRGTISAIGQKDRVTSVCEAMSSPTFDHELAPATLRRRWPLPNVHLMVSAETQSDFDHRVGILMRVPAAVRGVSLEPLLGHIEPHWFWPLCIASKEEHDKEHAGGFFCEERSLDWAIPGGESGHGRRTMPLDALLHIVDVGRQAGVPLYVKQDSHLYPGKQGRIPDSYWIHEFPKAA